MLLAFESAAKSLNFTLAGKDLNLTQSAISHQIRSLEESLDVQLFDRSRQGLELTSAGKLLLSRLRPALDTLESALLETAASQHLGALNVAVVPTFASKWLIPRMATLSKINPGMVVNLSIRLTPFDFREEQFDAAIYFGDPNWPHAQCDVLMGEEMIVVCSPGLAQTLKMPADLAEMTLLHQGTRREAWADWAAAADVESVDTSQGPQFELFSMVSEAAAAGLGVAVLPAFLIADELNSGKLVSPFGPVVRSAKSYCLARSDARAGLPTVQRFRDWLLSEVAEAEGNLVPPAS